MEFPTWVWDTAIGILGIAVMFLFVKLGSKKKGIIGLILTFTGVILGGALLALAVDRTLLEKIF